MKKQISLLLSLLLSMPVFSQINNEIGTALATQAVSAKVTNIGFFSYQEVMQSSEDYASAMKSIDELKAKYALEMKRVTDEFNSKYEAFLDGQRDFAPAIRAKRQAELQDMLEKNIAFKQESERLIEKAKTEAFAPIKAKINALLQVIAKENNLIVVLNTDNDNVPYIDKEQSMNLNLILQSRLR